MPVNPFISKKSLEEVSEWVMNTPAPPQLIIRDKYTPNTQTPSFGLFGGIHNYFAKVMPTYNLPITDRGVPFIYTSINCQYPGGFWNSEILDKLKFPTRGTCPALNSGDITNIQNYLMSVPIKTKLVKEINRIQSKNWFVTLNPTNATMTVNTSDINNCWQAVINYEGTCSDCQFVDTYDNQVAQHAISLQLLLRPCTLRTSDANLSFRGVLVNSLTWRLKIVTEGGSNGIQYSVTDNIAISSSTSENTHAFPISMDEI